MFCNLWNGERMNVTQSERCRATKIGIILAVAAKIDDPVGAVRVHFIQ
jgi:hypothetical protein